MLKECINGLKLKPGQTVVDATLGGAGHSAEIARKITGGTLIGIDRDSSAIEAGGKVLGKVLDDASDVTVYLIKSNFADIENVLQDVNIDKVNGILADLGVSSHQIDSPERGFSYMRDADLDMRMDTEDGHTAADIVTEYPEKKLADIIFRFGEERYANRIASAIVANRPVTRTLQLAEIIKAAVPAGYGKTGGHPAKRTFQSIRIAVNRELESIEKFLPAAVAALKKGGRLAVITFHSLEDRIVKQAF
jgi:16S rRNA (cytosine1402-N4)-methyltransferase